MNSVDLAVKLLTECENSENLISKILITYDKKYGLCCLEKDLGSQTYLQTFVPDSRKHEYYTISEEVKDEIKILISSKIPMKGDESFIFSIYSNEDEDESIQYTNLAVKDVHKDIIKVLADLNIDYDYEEIEDHWNVSPEQQDFCITLGSIYTLYINTKNFTDDKKTELYGKILIECSNKKIEQISDKNKQIEKICDIIESLDK